MKQLIAELIALDIFLGEDRSQPLYGAVSIGEDWRFACLDRKAKSFTEDIKLYRVPEETEVLLSVLICILSDAEVHEMESS